jgi:hypothetical protein
MWKHSEGGFFVEYDETINRLVELGLRGRVEKDGSVTYYEAKTGIPVNWGGRVEPALPVPLVKVLNLKVPFSIIPKRTCVPVTVIIQGDLVKVVPVINDHPRPVGRGGVSGRKIRGFSKRSRRRLMALCASTDRSPDVFATFTNDDSILRKIGPEKENYPELLNAKMKIDLHRFFVAIKFKFPGIGLVWRIDQKSRISGKYIGYKFPHCHWLVWLNGYKSEVVRAWCVKKWIEYTGSTNKHAKMVTRRRKSWLPLDGSKAVMYYISKYVGKVEDNYGYATGRVWGRIGEVPIGEIKEFPLKLDETKQIRRIFRRWKKDIKSCESYIKRTMNNGVTCSLFLTGPVVERLIHFIMQSKGVPF